MSAPHFHILPDVSDWLFRRLLEFDPAGRRIVGLSQYEAAQLVARLEEDMMALGKGAPRWHRQVVREAVIAIRARSSEAMARKGADTDIRLSAAEAYLALQAVMMTVTAIRMVTA
ncbi:MAG: hypothetical protein AAFY65_01260 [Pseudomonadota bacterium]